MKKSPSAQPADRYFTSDGLKLHYAEWGEPGHDTLIFVHGIRDQSRSWDFFLAALLTQVPRFFHVAALDLRGHGDSQWSAPERGYRHEDFVLDLAGLSRHLNKDSLTLIGHSLGGNMAMLFAGCFPAKVKKLVLIEAAGPYARADKDIPELLARWLQVSAEEGQNSCYATVEEAAGVIRNRFPNIPYEATVHMARYGTRPTGKGLVWKYDPRVRIPSHSSFSESQVRAFIERIDCPTLLVCGGDGDFMRSPRASRMALFRNRILVEIPGSGHHVPHERPEELAKVVRSFLIE